eukprot:gnl/Dysnectes_brevis/1248_a1394_2249.p1 GENE.gnl/Dysnectes_brevis/1248_a1394_2249~~gnl/Dysnectes_brevis/1248_a1394_2249.p1  ORF type:complete len:444 (+),score=102.71 gnl/Dysnectes_brevis/1248_a1394_2249:200-1531(+)
MSSVSARFVERLKQLHSTRGTPIRRLPIIGHKELDLYKLFVLVEEKGGFQEVRDKKLFKAIGDHLSLPQTVTNAGYVLRTKYENLLLPFDNALRHEFLDKPFNGSTLPGSASYIISDLQGNTYPASTFQAPGIAHPRPVGMAPAPLPAFSELDRTPPLITSRATMPHPSHRTPISMGQSIEEPLPSITRPPVHSPPNSFTRSIRCPACQHTIAATELSRHLRTCDLTLHQQIFALPVSAPTPGAITRWVDPESKPHSQQQRSQPHRSQQPAHALGTNRFTLRRLSLKRKPVTLESLNQVFEFFPALEYLELGPCHQLTDFPRHFPNTLRALRLTNLPKALVRKLMEHVSRLPHLQDLDVEFMEDGMGPESCFGGDRAISDDDMDGMGIPGSGRGRGGGSMGGGSIGVGMAQSSMDTLLPQFGDSLDGMGGPPPIPPPLNRSDL